MDRAGFFKVHRKIFESDLWPNKNASRLFLYLLGHAAWEPLKTDARYQSVALQPGDVLTGLHRLAADCALTVREVRNAIVCLKRASRITVRATNRFSVISIVNWDLYQNVPDEKGKQESIEGGKRKGKQTTSRGQAEGNIEEVKNLSIKEKPIDPSAGAPGAPALIQGNGKAHPKPRKEYPQPAQDLYETYRLNIIDVPAKKADALRNIAARLRGGYTPEQLTGAVERYFEERQRNPDALPFHANNFFGQKAYFLGYLSEAEPATPEAVHG